MRINLTLDDTKLLALDQLLRIHIGSEEILKQDKKREARGLDLEYAERLLRIRELLELDPARRTFQTPQFRQLVGEDEPPGV